jgi:FAD/FMN-containing dehydrogenase
VDAAIAEGGSYYLPYQVHATRDQFLKAYPRAEEYFAVKRRVDPNYKFRNRLWEAYFR